MIPTQYILNLTRSVTTSLFDAITTRPEYITRLRGGQTDKQIFLTLCPALLLPLSAYVGEFANGFEHGQGKLRYSNGSIFEGGLTS